MSSDLAKMYAPYEVNIPASCETAQVQILTMTRPHKEMHYPMTATLTVPLQETRRVIDSGKYRLELVMPSVLPGTPTLIIYEEDEQ